jgi:hypothetical protein
MQIVGSSQAEKKIYLQAHPDAVRVVALDNHKAKRLSDLALHRTDLTFANECLDALNTAPVEPAVLREALWRSAIIHYVKCFGEGVRFQLQAAQVYKGEPAIALEQFGFFKSLRHKHFIHDENSLMQSIPIAAINNGTKAYKVEEVSCFTTNTGTLNDGNWGNLKKLVETASLWVIKEFDSLAERLRSNLETKPYEELLAMADAEYRSPKIEDIAKKR